MTASTSAQPLRPLRGGGPGTYGSGSTTGAATGARRAPRAWPAAPRPPAGALRPGPPLAFFLQKAQAPEGRRGSPRGASGRAVAAARRPPRAVRRGPLQMRPLPWRRRPAGPGRHVVVLVFLPILHPVLAEEAGEQPLALGFGFDPAGYLGLDAGGSARRDWLARPPASSLTDGMSCVNETSSALRSARPASWPRYWAAALRWSRRRRLRAPPT